MNTYIQKLKNYLADTPLDFEEDDVNSVLEFLYKCYMEEKAGDSETIRAGFGEIDQLISSLTLDENNRIFELVCDLCSEHGKRAYLEGIHIGVRLQKELD